MDLPTPASTMGLTGFPYISWEDEIAERVPDLDSVIWRVVRDQLLLAGTVIGDAGTHDAVRLIVNQAVNDLISLLSEVASGAGRPAMRSARTLIEHAINLHTVAEGLPSAQRYLDHLELGDALLLDTHIGAELLVGKTRRVYQQNLDRIGKRAKRAFDKAVLLYGSSFRRGWSEHSLADRARTHGLSDLYRYYRLASLVAHGAAGGTLGSTRSHREGFTSHRSGQALELAPVALLAGLRGYRALLAAVAIVRADLDIAPFNQSITDLEQLWPDYFAGLTKLDNALWPDGRTASPVAVYAYNQTGQGRWWLHVPAAALLVEASEPKSKPAWFAERMREAYEYTIEHRPDLFTPTQRWLTVRVDSVSVVPLPGGRSVPDTAFLEQRDDWKSVEYETILGPSARPGQG